MVEAGALGAALDLATAGGLGLEESAIVMSTALNAFKKDGMSAAQAADILAGTANASATGVSALAESLAQVSAVASGSGLSFKDTNLALGVFANNGLKGSDAGTSLKQMLLTLQPITDMQRGLFEDLGFTVNGASNAFYDSKDNIKSTAEIAGVLRTKLGKLTNAQRQLTLKLMFGTDAIRAANILYEEGEEGIKKFESAMSNVKALDVAKKKMEGAGGAVEQLQGAFETLQISALIPTMPLITRFANGVSKLIQDYSPQITAAMEKMVASASGYLDKHFTNNEAFKRIPDIKGKIKFIFEDIMKTFSEWMDGGGSAQISAVAKKAIDLLAVGLQNSQPLVAAAIDLGVAIGNGILKGILSVETLKMFLGKDGPTLNVTNKYKEEKSAEKTGTYTLPSPGQSPYRTGKEILDSASQNNKNNFSTQKSLGFSGGLDNVPYNNFPARLHQGESVLTREENKDYRENSGGSGGQVVITGNTFHVREEADIHRIAGQLARLMAT
ncbi:TP901 family phage tail tape measure protein [Paenibacillus sp. DS2015]